MDVHNAMRRVAEERQAEYNRVVAEAREQGRATKVHIELVMAWKDCVRACRYAKSEGQNVIAIEEKASDEWSRWLWGRTPAGRIYRLYGDTTDPQATVPRLAPDEEPESWAEDVLYKLAQEGLLHYVTADDIDEFLYEMGRGAATPVAEAYIEKRKDADLTLCTVEE